MLKIIDYIKKNGLSKTCDDFSLTLKDYDNFFLLKYSQIDSPLQIEEVQECRGLILEKETLNVLLLSFKKFFNYGEGSASPINWSNCSILEKVDGSLISLWYYNGKWNTSTTGTALGEGLVNNKMGTSFSDLFWETINKYSGFNENLLDRSKFYMLELMTPYNMVVTPHNVSMVNLLTVRDKNTLEELTYDDVVKTSKYLNIPVVKRYDIQKDINFIVNSLDDKPFIDEGYVVCDNNFNRIKIKNPKYVACHHLKSKTSEHNIMVIIKSNEVDEFISSFKDREDEILSLSEKYHELINELNKLVKYFDTQIYNNRKDFALDVIETLNIKGLSMFNSLFFNLKDNKVGSVEEYIMEFDNKKLYYFL